MEQAINDTIDIACDEKVYESICDSILTFDYIQYEGSLFDLREVYDVVEVFSETSTLD